MSSIETWRAPHRRVDESAGLDDRVPMARVFAGLELVGVSLVLIWVFIPGSEGIAKGWVSVVAVAAFVQASALWWGSARVPPRLLSALLAFATGLVSVAVYLSGAELSPVAFFYVWVVGFAAWYLPRVHTALHVAWVIVANLTMMLANSAFALSKGWSVSTMDLTRWTMFAGGAIATAVLVRTFRNTFLDNEQRFLLGFECAPAMPLALATLESRLSRVNDAFCDLVGRPETELVGLSLEEIMTICPSDVEPLLGGSGKDLKHPQRREARLIAADGLERRVYVSCSLVSDRRGRPLHDFAQLLDITARRHAERQLEKRASREVAIAELGRSALQGADVSDLSDRIAALAAAQLGADLTTIIEHDAAAERFRAAAWHDCDATRSERAVARAANSLAAYAIASDRPELERTGRPMPVHTRVCSNSSRQLGAPSPFPSAAAAGHTAC